MSLVVFALILWAAGWAINVRIANGPGGPTRRNRVDRG